MKLKNKIIVGIIMILVLSFVPEVSLFTGLWNVTRNLDRLYTEAWTVSRCASDLKENLSLSYDTLISSLMSRNKFVSELNMEALLDYDRKMRDAAYSLETYAYRDMYSEEIEIMTPLIEEWRSVRDEVASSLYDEDYTKAYSICSGELHDSTAALSQAASSLNTASDKAASDFAAQGKLKRKIAMSVALGLSALKIAVAVIVIIKLVKAVARPVKSIKATIELVSRGTDIMEHIKYDTKDDFIAVKDMCKHLIEQLKGLIADME